jgi:hypothetical protein
MFLLKSFFAIVLVMTLPICVKAETHTVAFINKWVGFVDSSLNPSSLTRTLDAALALYVMNLIGGDNI